MIKEYNVGIYLRLSKEDEKLGESTSISNQRDIIKKYISENNLTLVNEYIDDGVSGTTFDRIGFKKMINDIENKKINMIITKDLSRFGRNEAMQLRYLDYFYENEIRYVSILDNVDTFDEYNVSNEMIPIQCFFNEKHVRDTSKKMKASVYNKRSQGNFLGYTPPYGYKKDPNDKYKLVIDEESAMVVKRIYDMFIKGIGICKIAKTLTEENIPIPSEYKKLNRGIKSTAYGIWGNRTISDILTLPTYMGDLTQGRLKKNSYKSKKITRQKKEEWIICKNKCPAIIEKNVFELAQNIYQKNKNKTKNNQNILLKGIVYCKECKHTIGFRINKYKTKEGKKEKCYGNCNYWVKHKKYNLCTPHNIKYHELEKEILRQLEFILKNVDKEKIKNKLKNNDKSKQTLNKLENQNNKLQSEINLYEKRMINLYNDKLEDVIDVYMYKKMCDKLNKDRKRIEDEIDENQKKINRLNKIINKKDDKYETMINKYLSISNISEQLLSCLIERIEIDENQNIDIYYKFNNQTFDCLSINTITK